MADADLLNRPEGAGLARGSPGYRQLLGRLRHFPDLRSSLSQPVVEQGCQAAGEQQAGHAVRHGQGRPPEGRGDQGGGETVETGLDKGLAGGGQPALHRKGIEGENGQAGHGHRHAQGVDEQGHDAPRQAGRQAQVEREVGRCGASHDGIAEPDGAGQRNPAGQAAGQAGADDHAAHGRPEQPEKAGFRQAEVGHQEDRCRQHVEEESGEVERHGGAGKQEGRRTDDLAIGGGEITGAQRLAFFRRQRLGQEFPAGQPQPGGGHGQEGKDGSPAEQGLQPAADDRGDGRGQRKHHGDLRHQALGGGTVVQVADDGPADDHAGPGGDALHGAPEPQVFDTGGQRTAGRGEGKQAEGDENDLAPAEAVGNGAMPEGHRGEGEQVDGQGLLNLQRRRVQFFGDFVEGGQVGIDGKRPEGGKGGQQKGEAACLAPGLVLTHG